jgi:hypothetical protein
MLGLRNTGNTLRKMTRWLESGVKMWWLKFKKSNVHIHGIKIIYDQEVQTPQRKSFSKKSGTRTERKV